MGSTSSFPRTSRDSRNINTFPASRSQRSFALSLSQSTHSSIPSVRGLSSEGSSSNIPPNRRLETYRCTSHTSGQLGLQHCSNTWHVSRCRDKLRPRWRSKTLGWHRNNRRKRQDRSSSPRASRECNLRSEREGEDAVG